MENDNDNPFSSSGNADNSAKARRSGTSHNVRCSPADETRTLALVAAGHEVPAATGVQSEALLAL